MEWHPIQAARQSGPNEWGIWSGRSSDHPKGIILRVEFGFYREAWFRAVIVASNEGGPKLLGWHRTAEKAAEAIWGYHELDSHEKRFPGYPAGPAVPPRANTNESPDRSK